MSKAQQKKKISIEAFKSFKLLHVVQVNIYDSTYMNNSKKQQLFYNNLFNFNY